MFKEILIVCVLAITLANAYPADDSVPNIQKVQPAEIETLETAEARHGYGGQHHGGGGHYGGGHHGGGHHGGGHYGGGHHGGSHYGGGRGHHHHG